MEGIVLVILGIFILVLNYPVMRNPPLLRKLPKSLRSMIYFQLRYNLQKTVANEDLSDDAITKYARRQVYVGAGLTLVGGLLISLVIFSP